MGARQSKRVEISSTPKKGEVENGAIVGTEEKLEKIEEGETVASKTNANGSTTTSSTVTAEQQETVKSNVEIAAAVSETTPSKEVVIKSESVTEVVGSAEKSIDEETISPSNVEDDNKEQETKSTTASPTEGTPTTTTTTTEDGASASTEKKKKPKKKWSFRSFSFSRKDRQKPVPSKEEPKQQDALPEGNEAVSQAEQQNDEDAEKLKKKGEEEEKKKKDDQVPPPLPTSPPPTPAEEIAVVATSVAPVSVAPVPVKEESPIISEADVDASGGGEALAEPLEEGELERSTPLTTISTTVTTTTTSSDLTNATPALTNGMNGVSKLNGEVTENGELPSPVCELKAPIDVESVTAKIDSLKLQITTDNVESPAQNGFGDHSFNGESNGVDGEVSANVSSDCHLVSDSVVSVDCADVSADASAD